MVVSCNLISKITFAMYLVEKSENNKYICMDQENEMRCWANVKMGFTRLGVS